MIRLHPSSFVSYSHPCNEFTIGYVPPKKVSDKEREYDRVESLQWERHEIEERYFWGGYKCIRFNILYWDKILDAKRFTPLGSSNVPICHNQKSRRAKRGAKGLTNSAARTLRNAVCVLEQLYKKDLGFYTFTLPSIDKDSLKIFISEFGGWSRLVRVFMQRLKRFLIRRGGDGNMAGCSEIQSKRYQRRKEIAPHLHLLFKARSRSRKFYVLAYELRDIWISCVKRHLERCHLGFIEVDSKASVDCQLIKKSAHNYVAKYISKGGKIIRQIAEEEGEKYLCSNWSHISDKLRKFTAGQVRSLDDSLLQAILNGVNLVSSGYLEFLHPIKLILGDEERICGYFGKHSVDVYKLDKEEYYREVLYCR